MRKGKKFHKHWTESIHCDFFQQNPNGYVQEHFKQDLESPVSNAPDLQLVARSPQVTPETVTFFKNKNVEMKEMRILEHKIPPNGNLKLTLNQTIR